MMMLKVSLMICGQVLSLHMAFPPNYFNTFIREPCAWGKKKEKSSDVKKGAFTHMAFTTKVIRGQKALRKPTHKFEK